MIPELSKLDKHRSAHAHRLSAVSMRSCIASGENRGLFFETGYRAQSGDGGSKVDEVYDPYAQRILEPDLLPAHVPGRELCAIPAEKA